MTQPGHVAPATPGWWVRTNRVGTNKTGTNWAISATGGRDSLGTASGSYTWAGSATGSRGTEFSAANAVVNATSVPIPPHSVGDLIVIFARLSGGSSPAAPAAGGTVPAWVSVAASDASGSLLANCTVVQYIATATNHTSGVWTLTDSMVAAVITEANLVTPIGGSAAPINQSVPNSCAAPSITMTNTDQTSVLLHFHGWGDGSNPITSISAAPAGYTRRATAILPGASGIGVCLNTKDVTSSDGAINQPAVGNPYTVGATVEVLAR